MVTPIEELLADDYLEGLDGLSMGDLRARRGECQEVETGLSYFRRLVQGRLDIVHAELTRRQQGGEPSDLEQLIEQLPTILAEHSGGPGRGLLSEVVVPEDIGRLTAELSDVIDADRLASLPAQSQEEVDALADRLTDLERTVSGQRKALFERIDALQAEIVKRYKSGEATVDALLR